MNDSEEDVSLLDYLAVLVNHLRLIVLIVVVTVATAVVGVLVMARITEEMAQEVIDLAHELLTHLREAVTSWSV